MKTRTTEHLIVVLLLAAFAASAVAFQYAPDQVASHWNFKGEADGTLPKFWGLFIAPLVMLFFVALFRLIPRIDPLRKNIEGFRNVYNHFALAMTGFFFYMHLLIIVWNAGYQFNMSRAVWPAVAGLWYVIGHMIGKAKRNFFIGIRTPWTLTSDEVWNKTHALGGKLFKWTAPLVLVGMLLPEEYLWVIILILIIPPLALIPYSYYVYAKQSKNR